MLSATYDATRTTDGALDTFWSTPYVGGITTEWLVLDLGAAVGVARVSLHPRVGLATSFPRDFQIQTSTDNVNYATVLTRNDFVAAADTWNDFDFATASARYVRLLITEPGFVGTYRTVQLARSRFSSRCPRACCSPGPRSGTMEAWVPLPPTMCATRGCDH